MHGLQRGVQAWVAGRPVPAGCGRAAAEVASEGEDEQHVEQAVEHGLLAGLHVGELAGHQHDDFAERFVDRGRERQHARKGLQQPAGDVTRELVGTAQEHRRPMVSVGCDLAVLGPEFVRLQAAGPRFVRDVVSGAAAHQADLPWPELHGIGRIVEPQPRLATGHGMHRELDGAAQAQSPRGHDHCAGEDRPGCARPQEVVVQQVHTPRLRVTRVEVNDLRGSNNNLSVINIDPLIMRAECLRHDQHIPHSAHPGAHAGARYALTGPQALTFGDVAAIIAAVSGRPVGYKDIDQEAWISGAIAAGVPADYAVMLRWLTGVIVGGDGSKPTGDVETVTGRPSASFEAFARRHAAAWTTPEDK